MGDGHVPRSRLDTLNRGGVTEGRVAELVTAGVIAAATNIYQQVGEETAKNLEIMEDRVVERVLRELHEQKLTSLAQRWFTRVVLRRNPVSVLRRNGKIQGHL